MSEATMESCEGDENKENGRDDDDESGRDDPER
jgi:hypothetical protein